MLPCALTNSSDSLTPQPNNQTFEGAIELLRVRTHSSLLDLKHATGLAPNEMLYAKRHLFNALFSNIWSQSVPAAAFLCLCRKRLQTAQSRGEFCSATLFH